MQTDSESYFMEKFDSLHNSQKEAILLCTEANSTCMIFRVLLSQSERAQITIQNNKGKKNQQTSEPRSLCKM